MNDTHPEIEKIYHEMMMKRTSEERMQMASSMYDAARLLAIASFPEGLSKKEIHKRLFLRFYSDDFSEEFKKNYLAKIDEIFEELNAS